MRVWVVNPFDNLPCEGYRPLRYWTMCETFARLGDDVTYWTCDFSHIAKRKRIFLPGFPAPPFRLAVVESPEYSRNVSLKRALAHVAWARNWRRAAEAEKNAPDIVVASSPPLSAARQAGVFARRCGAKFVLDVQDVWPETFERVVPGFLLFPLRQLAKSNYRSADAVTAVSDRFLEVVRSYGFKGPAKRFYHGIDMSAPFVRAAASGGGRLKIAYAGSLGVTYDLVTAIEAVAMDPGLELAIAGEGERRAELERLASSMRADGRVSFRGYLGDAELGRFLASADAGLVPMSPESCVGIPYKLADYARAGLAVASSLGGECDALLARYGAGVHYRPGDPASLAMSLSALRANLPAMRRGAREMAEKEFDARAIYTAMRTFISQAPRS